MLRLLLSTLSTAALLLAWPLTANAEGYLLRGAKLYDGQGGPAIPAADILIQDGRIQRIAKSGEITPPAGVQVRDYTGKTIVPGLISAHSHVGQYEGTVGSSAAYNRDNIEQQLQQFQTYGVTTVAALGLNRPLIYEYLKPEGKTLAGASLLVADRGIGVVDGAPTGSSTRIAPDQLDRPDTVEAARAAVRGAKERGAHLIKIWLESARGTIPKMRKEIFTAVIDEAHRQGLRVASHVYTLEDAKDVVMAGVDIIAHGVRDVPVDDEFIELLKSHQVVYVPTIALDEAGYIYADSPAWMETPFFQEALSPALKKQFADPAWRKSTLESPRTKLQRENVKMNQRNTLALYKAGVTIALGTDSGAFPERIPGFAEHRELLLLAQAGLPLDQIIRIATKNSAAALKLADRGTLVADQRADLLVLAGDPGADPAAWQQIVAVWQAGKPVHGEGEQ